MQVCYILSQSSNPIKPNRYLVSKRLCVLTTLHMSCKHSREIDLQAERRYDLLSHVSPRKHQIWTDLILNKE
jgi:hypothetical protein